MYFKAVWFYLTAIFLVGLAAPTLKKSPQIQGHYLLQFPDHSDSNHITEEIIQHIQQHSQIKVQVINVFDHALFHGASLRIQGLPEETIQGLLVHPQISSIYPMALLSRRQTQSAPIYPPSALPGFEAVIPHSMTQVDRVHRELGNTGEGILVGIIDDGIDYYHPALGGGFGPGFKVRVGRDLIGAHFNTSDPNSIPSPDSDPLDDCDSGHGTHVAGIIAGKSENFTGVAPDANLGMWRALDCHGQGRPDVTIQALLEAYDAKCDIISLSWGGFDGWSESPAAVVAQRIVENGVPVVAAIGNMGENGTFTASDPAVGLGVISVASIDNQFTVSTYFTVGDDQNHIEYQADSGIFPPRVETLAIGVSNIGSDQDACDPSTVLSSVNGSYAVVMRGTCLFAVKAQNLAAAGATGVVIINNVGGAFAPLISDFPLQIIGVGLEDGKQLIASLKEKDRVPAYFGYEVKPVASAKTASFFSSVGPSFEGHLHPAISGVGGYVYSTLPRRSGSWGVMSGTSMAAPYVAGSVALYLKSLNGTKPSPAFIAEQFQNYAYKAVHENGKPGIDSPLRQGAGLVQVFDTIQQRVHVSPGSISANDSSSPSLTHTLTITNTGTTTVAYQLSNNASLAVAPYNLEKSGYALTSPARFMPLDARVLFSTRTVIVRPGATQQVTVTIVPPNADPAQHYMYGGYIQFKSRQATPDITVPYFGILGDQRQLPIFKPNTPFLTNRNMSKVFQANESYSFYLSDPSTMPACGVEFLTPTAHMVTDMIHGGTGAIIGKGEPDLLFIGRNLLNTLIFSTPWNGSVISAETSTIVPPGIYHLQLRALKLYGDPAKDSDWETWTSPRIHVFE